MALPDRPKGSTDKYLKLDPDTSVEGVLIGKPSFFYRRYEEGKYQYLNDYEAGYSFRFQMNFIVREKDGKLEPKIFENGGPFYDRLKEFSDSYEVERTWIKILRKGTGKDTRYDFMPLPDGKVTDEHKAILDKAELHQLRGTAGASFGTLGGDEDVPF